MNYKISVTHNITEIPAEQWNDLAQNAGPFLRHEFLHALEDSRCCCNDTGWLPCHVVVKQDNQLLVAIPGYLKTHSYGEYVFDHVWANAYHQNGRDYYPKWISAIPFTPVTGSRVLCADEDVLTTSLFSDITEALKVHCHTQYGVTLSSMHWLFSDEKNQRDLHKKGSYLQRYSVQFQWHNYQYADFHAFLDALTSRKRKDFRKVRRQHAQQGIQFTHHTGNEITDHILHFFMQCYQSTYLKRSGHTGYLNDDLFQRLRDTMANNMLIVVAREHGKPIASALFFFDDNGLYGRYWGSLKDISGLHFACCYFEGIEFAIANNLPLFNPGTQGEHKILRGFEPIYCRSSHQLFEGAFHCAVADFLQQETQHIIHYFNQARNALPFNENFVPHLKTTSVRAPNTEDHNEKNDEI